MTITFAFEDKKGRLKKLEVNQNIFYFFVDAKKVEEFEAQGLVYEIIKNLDSVTPININQLECELLDQIRRSTINACIG